METILLTGGAGFVGSHLLERLLKTTNDIIIVVDNFNDYYDPRIKRENIRPFLKDPRFILKEGDIRDLSFLTEVFERYAIDRVIHLAAMAGVRSSIETPAVYVDVDVKGTVHLLELARRRPVRNFVFASSSSVYGINPKTPFAETDPADAQISPYAAAKRAGEIYGATYARLYGFPVVSLRFFTVYGPRQRPEMAIHRFTRLIDEGRPIPFFGDGSSRRDYTYIDDIIDGLVAAMAVEEPGHAIYNLGNSHTVTLSRLVQIIEENIGKKALIERLPEQTGDVPITYADLTLAERHLGYRPKVGLEEGVRRFVAWYRELKEAK